MVGKNVSLQRWPVDARFYLDECFGYQIAEALSMVDYPITWPYREGKIGAKDEALIPWLAEQKLVWITRDAAARRAHGPLIRKHGLSVLWIRGVQREKRGSVEQHVSTHDVHLLLTNELVNFAEHLRAARGRPRHGVIYLSGATPTLKRVDTELIDQGNPLKVVGSWRD